MNDRQSRREFMGLTAAGVAGVFARPWIGGGHDVAADVSLRAQIVSGAQRANPDLVVLNAKVYTMDPASPRAEAFATSGGRFVAVGRTADIRSLVKKGTETFD